MQAWIIAVGSELLTPLRVDTNSLAITERLNRIGYDVRTKILVGDEVGELSAALERAIEAGDLVVLTGGLGPTEDDITRDAVARVFGVPLDLDPAILEGIRDALRASRAGDAGDQPAAGDGPARRDGPGESKRHAPPASGSSGGEPASSLLPGPPREMTADARGGDRGPAGAAPCRRGTVPARAEDHRPDGVRRRRPGAADLHASGARRRCRSPRRSWRCSGRSSCT